MEKSKKLFSGFCVFLAGLLSIVSLTGCASSNKKSGGESSSSNTPVKLSIWSEIDTSHQSISLKSILDAYTKDHPNVTFDLQEIPTNGVDEKVTIALQSNTFPDIYNGAVQRLGPLAYQGVFAEYPSKMSYDFKWDNFVDAAVTPGVLNGKHYFFYACAPKVFGLMVNKALFKKAGVENLLPDPKTGAWTRDNYVKAAKAIHELGKDIYGCAYGISAIDQDKFIEGYVWSDGDSWTDTTLLKATCNTSKNIKNFEWVVNNAKQSYCLPSAASYNVGQIYPMFKAGKIGIMNENGGILLTDLQNSFNNGTLSKDLVDPEFCLYPTDDGSVAKVQTSAVGTAVKKQSDKAKTAAAFDLIAWMNQPSNTLVEKAYENATWGWATPRSLKAEISAYKSTNPLMEYYYSMVQKSITAPFSIPGYQQIRQSWLQNTQAAFVGQKTAKQARDTFQSDTQQIIDSNKK